MIIRKLLLLLGKIILIFFVLGILYVLTLCFPQLFFRNKIAIENLTIYSDEELPIVEITAIGKEALNRVQKSKIYKSGVEQRIFIANNPIRWRYFSNINYKVGGLNYVCFNHNIFLRRVDIKNNRLYGNSGKVAGGERTLDYFMAHELTHTLEFQSMPWYKYPIKTNWVLEGYCEYVAHSSQSYETALNQYLNVPENVGEKYYTRTRTMVSYLIEKEKINITKLWEKVDDYNSVLKMAIPDDKPAIKS